MTTRHQRQSTKRRVRDVVKGGAWLQEVGHRGPDSMVGVTLSSRQADVARQHRCRNAARLRAAL